jgi:hypothetical protein
VDISKQIAKEMKKNENEVEFLITSPYNDMDITITTTTTTTTAENDTSMHSLSKDELDSSIADSANPFCISGKKFKNSNLNMHNLKFRIHHKSFFFNSIFISCRT